MENVFRVFKIFFVLTSRAREPDPRHPFNHDPLNTDPTRQPLTGFSLQSLPLRCSPASAALAAGAIPAQRHDTRSRPDAVTHPHDCARPGVPFCRCVVPYCAGAACRDAATAALRRRAAAPPRCLDRAACRQADLPRAPSRPEPSHLVLRGPTALRHLSHACYCVATSAKNPIELNSDNSIWTRPRNLHTTAACCQCLAPLQHEHVRRSALTR
jgi:hypothetical protein